MVFEHVGKETWAGSMLCLKRGGRLVTCGSTSGVSCRYQSDDAVPASIAAHRFVWMPYGQHCNVNGEDGLADTSKPVVDTEIEFGDMATALERMESRKVFGKNHHAHELGSDMGRLIRKPAVEICAVAAEDSL